jgi:hypothetical protein
VAQPHLLLGPHVAGVQLQQALQRDHGLRVLGGGQQPLRLGQLLLDLHAQRLLAPHAVEQPLRPHEQADGLHVVQVGRGPGQEDLRLLEPPLVEEGLALPEGRLALLARGEDQDARVRLALPVQGRRVLGVQPQHLLEAQLGLGGVRLQQAPALGQAPLDVLAALRQGLLLAALLADAPGALDDLLQDLRLQDLGHFLGAGQAGAGLLQLAFLVVLLRLAAQAVHLGQGHLRPPLLLGVLALLARFLLGLPPLAHQLAQEVGLLLDRPLLLLGVEHLHGRVVVAQAQVADALLVVGHVLLDELQPVGPGRHLRARLEADGLAQAAQGHVALARAHQAVGLGVVLVPLLGLGQDGPSQGQRQEGEASGVRERGVQQKGARKSNAGAP